jgi:putative protease
LHAAVDAGADSVYIGFQSPTNLRNLPGLNFSVEEAADGVQYAHQRGAEVYVTVNTYPLDDQLQDCYRAIDDAEETGADAVIAADLAVLDYSRARHPGLQVHLSCVAGAADPASIRFYREEFGVSCVILPRVLSVGQIASLRRETDALLEAMVCGVLCANYDGRCHLSSFITGRSANSLGACAPADLVEFDETEPGRTVVRLNGLPISEFEAEEQRTYPTPCKGKYHNAVTDRRYHAFQDSCCLNALPLLPELAAAGVDMVKIEGRQRSLAYVKFVTSAWRSAIDALDGPHDLVEQKLRRLKMDPILEGKAGTLGALSGGRDIEDIRWARPVSLGAGGPEKLVS